MPAHMVPALLLVHTRKARFNQDPVQRRKIVGVGKDEDSFVGPEAYGGQHIANPDFKMFS